MPYLLSVFLYASPKPLRNCRQSVLDPAQLSTHDTNLGISPSRYEHRHTTITVVTRVIASRRSIAYHYTVTDMYTLSVSSCACFRNDKRNRTRNRTRNSPNRPKTPKYIKAPHSVIHLTAVAVWSMNGRFVSRTSAQNITEK